jgi:hypothetical protein
VLSTLGAASYLFSYQQWKKKNVQVVCRVLLPSKKIKQKKERKRQQQNKTKKLH